MCGPPPGPGPVTIALPCRGGIVVVVDVVDVDDVEEVDDVDVEEVSTVDDVEDDVVVVGGTTVEGHDTEPAAAAGPDVSDVITTNPATANTAASAACSQRFRTSVRARKDMCATVPNPDKAHTDRVVTVSA